MDNNKKPLILVRVVTRIILNLYLGNNLPSLDKFMNMTQSFTDVRFCEKIKPIHNDFFNLSCFVEVVKMLAKCSSWKKRAALGTAHFQMVKRTCMFQDFKKENLKLKVTAADIIGTKNSKVISLRWNLRCWNYGV